MIDKSPHNIPEVSPSTDTRLSPRTSATTTVAIHTPPRNPSRLGAASQLNTSIAGIEPDSFQPSHCFARTQKKLSRPWRKQNKSAERVAPTRLVQAKPLEEDRVRERDQQAARGLQEVGRPRPDRGRDLVEGHSVRTIARYI